MSFYVGDYLTSGIRSCGDGCPWTETPWVLGCDRLAALSQWLRLDADRAPESLDVAPSLTGQLRSTASGDWAGFAVRYAVPGRSPAALARATRASYDAVFQALRARGLLPARIWNVVPDINRHADARGFGALEHYKHFNAGRREAWLRYDASLQSVCAATAVGRQDGQNVLVLSGLATRATLEHFENPKQVPFLEYSTRYGPPPCSRRGTRARLSHRQSVVFVAGTASIMGEGTVYAAASHERVLAQTDVTLANIMRVLEQAGAQRWRTGAVRIYVRQQRLLNTIVARAAQVLSVPAQDIDVMGADICRKPLDVEIECAALSP